MKWFRVTAEYLDYEDPDGVVPMVPGLVVGVEVQPVGWIWGDGEIWAVVVAEGRVYGFPARNLEAVS